MIRIAKRQPAVHKQVGYSFYHAGKRVGGFALQNDDAGLSLWDVEIVPRYTGRGYGKELIHDIIQEAKRIGCSTIWLLVLRSNKRAIHLYEVTGWKIVWSDNLVMKMVHNLQGE